MITIDFSVEPDALFFTLHKEGSIIYASKMPSLDIDSFERLCVVFSYSSKGRVARTLSNLESSSVVQVDLGWVFASDIQIEVINLDREVFKNNSYFGVMEALMSPADAQRFSEPVESGQGILVTSEYLSAIGPFPE